jgi:glycosyltransferase involved in cell wall biosynthesis
VDVVPEFEGRNTTIRRWTANDADVVTAVSEHTAETARREFGIDPTVIYNGVDTDLFNPGYDWPQTFDKLNLSSPPFVYVGAFWDRKRPHDVVEVAKRCPSHDFVMIGDGGTYEEVKKAASGVENVFLTGRLPKASLPAIYANALGLIFPTVQEGCPNVVLEAMSSETPVIGYEATSMPELVTTGTSGYLTDVGNLASLAEGVERVSNHSDEMGANARNYIQQNHTFDRIASQYMSVYRRALGGAEV